MEEYGRGTLRRYGQELHGILRVWLTEGPVFGSVWRSLETVDQIGCLHCLTAVRFLLDHQSLVREELRRADVFVWGYARYPWCRFSCL